MSAKNNTTVKVRGGRVTPEVSRRPFGGLSNLVHVKVAGELAESAEGVAHQICRSSNDTLVIQDSTHVFVKPTDTGWITVNKRDKSVNVGEDKTDLAILAEKITNALRLCSFDWYDRLSFKPGSHRARVAPAMAAAHA